MDKKERLLILIKNLNAEGVNRRRIEKDLNKSEGYLDRAVSTGVISDRALDSIESLYEKTISGEVLTKADIAVLQSSIEVILKEIAKIKKDLYKNETAKYYFDAMLEEISLSDVGKRIQKDH